MADNHKTIGSYDRIAPEYMEINRDRSVIQKSFDRFTHYLKTGDTIIDVGCGPGFDAAIFRDMGFTVFAMDRSFGMMDRGRREFGEIFVQADMRQLPFFNSAHGLWVNASLLHLERDDVPNTLCQFYLALKKGGILLVSVIKGAGEEWTTSPYGKDASRWFTYWEEEHLDTLLSAQQFEILESWSSMAPNRKWLVRICRK